MSIPENKTPSTCLSLQPYPVTDEGPQKLIFWDNDRNSERMVDTELYPPNAYRRIFFTFIAPKHAIMTYIIFVSTFGDKTLEIVTALKRVRDGDKL